MHKPTIFSVILYIYIVLIFISVIIIGSQPIPISNFIWVPIAGGIPFGIILFAIHAIIYNQNKLNDKLDHLSYYQNKIYDKLFDNKK